MSMVKRKAPTTEESTYSTDDVRKTDSEQEKQYKSRCKDYVPKSSLP